ncbi:hypothetical protein [Streptomyces subrutilus]
MRAGAAAEAVGGEHLGAVLWDNAAAFHRIGARRPHAPDLREPSGPGRP